MAAWNYNHDYVEGMGTMRIFDHNKGDVVEDIVEALKGSKFVGVYDAIGEEKMRSSADVLSRLGGVVVTTTLLPPESSPNNVEAKRVFCSSI